MPPPLWGRSFTVLPYGKGATVLANIDDVACVRRPSWLGVVSTRVRSGARRRYLDIAGSIRIYRVDTADAGGAELVCERAARRPIRLAANLAARTTSGYLCWHGPLRNCDGEYLVSRGSI